jgi:HK97 family phage major capsid protein
MSTVAQEKDLKTILSEMKELQEKYTGKIMPTEIGERFDHLAEEAKALQDEADRKRRIAQVEQAARQVDYQPLPGEEKTRRNPDEVVGYLRLGEAFTSSPAYQQFKATGFPHGMQAIAQFEGGSFHITPDGRKSIGEGLIPVTQAMIESKALPALGVGVIRPDRIAETVRWQERQQMTIRDVLNVSRTDSNTVEYTTISSSTRAAAPVAEGALKPEAALAMGVASAPVRTLATWIPITEQQLADIPQLQNIINVELTWDLQKVEEEQILWGLGTGQNLLGIFNTPGVVAGRTVANDTIIDLARRSMTDVVVAGLQPNAILMDPIDWETAQLAKATTNQYVWAVVTDDNGNRLWGLRVIETLAMREPGTFTTNERRMLVGDFMRGATLWDRQQAGVQVGWKNDDFIRNQRTLRAEERIAFGVKRPAAFKFRITQARVA